MDAIAIVALLIWVVIMAPGLCMLVSSQRTLRRLVAAIYGTVALLIGWLVGRATLPAEVRAEATLILGDPFTPAKGLIVTALACVPFGILALLLWLPPGWFGKWERD